MVVNMIGMMLEFLESEELLMVEYVLHQEYVFTSLFERVCTMDGVGKQEADQRDEEECILEREGNHALQRAYELRGGKGGE